MRILVIEDQATVRDLLRRMLESAGHEVVEAADGRLGVTAFEHQPVDVVVTDILMPNTDGIEAIRSLRAIAPDLRIVATSGLGNLERFDLLRYAHALGANATLAKPFTRAALLACIEGKTPTDIGTPPK